MPKSNDGQGAGQPLPYMVVQTRDQYQVDDTGKLVEMKIIFFRTAYGDTGSVAIPKTDFNAELAKTLIEIQVAEIAKLRG